MSLQEDFERFHAGVADAYLDAVARTAGCDPAIGRLNYLDDATVTSVVAEIGLRDGSRVLDLGCGRGFVGRWLAARGITVSYTAVDFAAGALEAVKRHLPDAACVRADLRSIAGGPYDAVFAVESFWAIDTEWAARLYGLLASDGTLVTSIASLDGSHGGRISETLTALERASFRTHGVAFAAGRREAVGRLSAAAMIEEQPDEWIRERVAGEAARTLAALRDGTFRCDAFVSRKN